MGACMAAAVQRDSHAAAQALRKQPTAKCTHCARHPARRGTRLLTDAAAHQHWPLAPPAPGTAHARALRCAQFDLDDEHVFTCVGTSGPAPPARAGSAAAPAPQAAADAGAGVPVVDSKVLAAAAAAMQGGRLAEAVRELALRRASGGQAGE